MTMMIDNIIRKFNLIAFIRGILKEYRIEIILTMMVYKNNHFFFFVRISPNRTKVRTCTNGTYVHHRRKIY